MTCGECKWWGSAGENKRIRVCNCEANDGDDIQSGFRCYTHADFFCPRFEKRQDWADRLSTRLHLVGWSQDEMPKMIRDAAQVAVNAGELRKEE